MNKYIYSQYLVKVYQLWYIREWRTLIALLLIHHSAWPELVFNAGIVFVFLLKCSTHRPPTIHFAETSFNGNNTVIEYSYVVGVLEMGEQETPSYIIFLIFRF